MSGSTPAPTSPNLPASNHRQLHGWPAPRSRGAREKARSRTGPARGAVAGRTELRPLAFLPPWRAGNQHQRPGSLPQLRHLPYLRQVCTLHRTRNKSAHDPTEGISIRLPDADEVDPFTREEIKAILGTASPRSQELNLARFMLWAGPRVSEVISLAWEDVDLKAGTVRFRRSQVRAITR